MVEEAPIIDDQPEEQPVEDTPQDGIILSRENPSSGPLLNSPDDADLIIPLGVDSVEFDPAGQEFDIVTTSDTPVGFLGSTDFRNAIGIPFTLLDEAGSIDLSGIVDLEADFGDADDLVFAISDETGLEIAVQVFEEITSLETEFSTTFDQAFGSGDFTFTINLNEPGEDNTDFSAEDLLINAFFEPVNQPPEFDLVFSGAGETTVTGPQSVTINGDLSGSNAIFDLVFNDPENDLLSFELIQAPTGPTGSRLEQRSDNSVAVALDDTIPPGQPVFHEIVVRATDAGGLFDDVIVEVTVTG